MASFNLEFLAIFYECIYLYFPALDGVDKRQRLDSQKGNVQTNNVSKLRHLFTIY